MNFVNKIYCKDSRNMLELPNESINMVFTSPPYNAGVEYDVHDDTMDFELYLNLLRAVFKECYRVMKKGARIGINVANINRKPYIPTADYIYWIMQDLGFLMRGEIIWIKTMGLNSSSTVWGSWMSASNPVIRDSHEYILIFCKEQYHLSWNGESDIGKKEFETFTRGEWNFNPIHTSRKLGHPAPFPVEMPKRAIKLYSYINDIILDPFAGTGTTCVAAKQNGRRYVGYDISKAYCKTATKRLTQKNIKGFMK